MNPVVVSNVHFSRATHTVKFSPKSKDQVVVVSVVASVSDRAGVAPRKFPALVVSRDVDGLFAVRVRGEKPPVTVWASNPRTAFARGVRAFWK